MKTVPNTIQSDILRRHTGPFLFVFLTIMFLLLMQFLMLYLDKIIGKGIPFSVVAELIFSNLAYMVVLAIPMAVLVASLMVFGAFSESNEFTAVRASGIHPFRIILPVAISGFLLFLLMAFFSNYILPEANYRARALFIDIRLKRPGFDLKEGVFYNGIDGYTFLVQHIPEKTDSLIGVTLFQEPINSRDEALIKAEKGLLSSDEGTQSLKLQLFDGEMYRTLRNKKDGSKTVEKTDFKQYQIVFDLSKLEFSRSNPESRGRNDRTMRVEAMYAVIQTLEKEKENDRTVAFNNNRTFRIDSLSQKFLTNNQDELLSTQFARIENLTAPFRSDVVGLDVLPSFEVQRQVLINTTRALRDRVATYESVLNTENWKIERQSKYWVEIHKKFAIPYGCLLFVFLGAPIGLLTKKGNLGVAAIISTLIFTIYWIGIIQGEKLADRVIISPIAGMWTINAFYTITALFLFIKISRGYIFRR